MNGIGMTMIRHRAAAGLLLAALAALPRAEAVASDVATGLPPGVAELVATWDAPPSHFPSRESTAAPLLGNGSLAVSFGGPAEALRFFINRNDFWRLSDNNQGKQKLAALLDLKMPALAGASYRLDQSIWDGAVRGTFRKENRTVHLTAWLSATKDVLVVELRAEGDETPVDLALTAPAEAPSKVESGAEGDTAWVVRTYAEGVDIPTEAATAVRILGAAGPRFILKPGVPVTLAVFSASAFDAPDPLAAVRERAAAWTPDRRARLRAGHADWWRAYWNRSWVTLDDPVLMKGYYQGLYTLAAASRNPRFPPAIFGPWITDDHPSWSNDYHLNYNFVAPFYGLYSANRFEQADPQDAPLIEFMPRGQWYAEQVTKTRGALYPVGIGPMGMEFSRGERYGVEHGSVEQGGTFHHQRSNAAYSLVNIAQRWRTTQDPAYAAKVYPFARAVAEFWEDYLVEVDSVYHIHGDAIHELSGANKNPILTLGLLRNAFDLVLDLSRALNVDVDRRETWTRILSNLAPFPTQERNGKTVFRYTSEGPDWWDGNTLGIQHIYPGNAIHPDSNPRLLEIGLNTVMEMNRWHDGNGSNSFFPAAVRVGYDPGVILDELRKYVENTWPNGFMRDNPHGIENCSTVHNTINEMLCMSAGHVLRLFPVWPKDKDAAFVNLRAWGAFLVSAEQKNGLVGGVRIVSERGRDCVLRNPWPGRAVAVTRNGRKAETLAGDRLTITTTAGESLTFTPVVP